MNPDIFTPELILKDLFDRWPQTMPVFFRHHMICVGCSMSVFDTLAEAMENYGLSWPDFQTELAAAAASNQLSGPELTNR